MNTVTDQGNWLSSAVSPSMMREEILALSTMGPSTPQSVAYSISIEDPPPNLRVILPLPVPSLEPSLFFGIFVFSVLSAEEFIDIKNTL